MRAALPERHMDDATRWRVIEFIMADVGCSIEEAVDAVLWLETVDSSEHMTVH
jgi:hypothetical protein